MPGACAATPGRVPALCLSPRRSESFGWTIGNFEADARRAPLAGLDVSIASPGDVLNALGAEHAQELGSGGPAAVDQEIVAVAHSLVATARPADMSTFKGAARDLTLCMCPSVVLTHLVTLLAGASCWR